MTRYVTIYPVIEKPPIEVSVLDDIYKKLENTH